MPNISIFRLVEGFTYRNMPSPPRGDNLRPIRLENIEAMSAPLILLALLPDFTPEAPDTRTPSATASWFTQVEDSKAFPKNNKAKRQPSMHAPLLLSLMETVDKMAKAGAPHSVADSTGLTVLDAAAACHQDLLRHMMLVYDLEPRDILIYAARFGEKPTTEVCFLLWRRGAAHSHSLVANMASNSKGSKLHRM